MNVDALKRKSIKSGLSRLSIENRKMFNKMYSHKNLDKPINKVVDGLSSNRLDNVLSQVTNTLNQYSIGQQIEHKLMGLIGK